jgi:hypothetical protein
MITIFQKKDLINYIFYLFELIYFNFFNFFALKGEKYLIRNNMKVIDILSR